MNSETAGKKKLDILVKLLARKSIEGKTQTDSILELGDLGLDRRLISEIVGASVETVRVRLSEAKRKRKSESRKVKEEAQS
jgi:hypothetical protein